VAINNLKDIDTSTPFSPPKKDDWQGRETNPALGIQYWHQAIKLFNGEELVSSKGDIDLPDICLLGYVCEEGVRRNKGRVGAKYGPRSVRERLAKLAYHSSAKTVGDCGDVNCVDAKLEICQNNLADVVGHLVKQGSLPIIIGGGHDIAYGHFLGLYEARKNIKGHKFGIVNFDAHFDLRPVIDQPNSGTPFNQILSKFGDQVKYFAIGIQPSGNTKEFYDIANRNSVQYIESTSCLISKASDTIAKLNTLIQEVDSLYITIDMDGFSSAYAPGVSAPSPFGFEPDFVLVILEYLLASNKVIACDIAELNPRYDQDSLTANLAARLIDFIVRSV